MGKILGLIISIILFILGLILLHGAVASAQTVNNNTNWNLSGKIEECENILVNSPKLQLIENKNKLIRKQVSLCILNINDGSTVEKRYWLSEKEVERANELRKYYKPNSGNLPRFIPVDRDNNFKIINVRWNGWNSNWKIMINGIVSDAHIVLADKYPAPDSYIVYPDEKTGPKYSDIIYSPYSEGLHNEEAVKKGTDYINEKVDMAFDELNRSKTMSRSFPGRLVTDTISRTFVKNILLVEQTDPDAILKKAVTAGQKRKVAEIVLVRYAFNRDRAFRYAVSKTGARGMAQIMPRTYLSILREYPNAGLIKNVNLGRVEPVNAIKTQILVFDDHLLYVIDKVNNSGPKAKKIFYGLSEEETDEVRAMIYNGGPSKYDVDSGTLKTKARGRRAKAGLNETRGFIGKLRVIRGLRFFD